MLQHQLPTLLALCLPPLEPQGLSSLSPTEHREGCHLASELRHEEQQGSVCWVSVLGPSGTTEGTGLCPGARLRGGAGHAKGPCVGARWTAHLLAGTYMMAPSGDSSPHH